jgi:hypothetical protein
MKTSQQTQEEYDRELDDLFHPERFVTRWMRIKFWFMNLDLRFFEAIGKTRRAFAKFKKSFRNS